MAFFQAEELNLDLGQRKGFPFGNTGVLCLPDTITSRVLVGTLAKTKIRVAFSHPSAYPGWWGPRWERLSGTIVTGSALRMLVTDTIAQISGHRTITVRKQFLAKDLRLINQEKKKSRKRPGVSRTVSQETILDNTTMMGMCHSWHICPNPQEWIPRQGFAPVGGEMEGLDCSCAEDDGWGLGGYAYVREGQVETIHTLCSVLKLHL